MGSLREKRRKSGPSSTTKELLAFAGPHAPGASTGDSASRVRGQELRALPEAEREVYTLRQLYGESRSEVRTGSAASEQLFKAEAGQFRVIHLAAHGILDDSNPMYSNIVLGRKETDAEDGLLEAREVMQMDLNADLVVLSACETARGRVTAGEGTIGLSWAFFVAGAPATVVSQWEVESSSTSRLMVGFHRALETQNRRGVPQRAYPGSATARALQSAELQMLHNPRYAHPFYWAGFVVMGDPN